MNRTVVVTRATAQAAGLVSLLKSKSFDVVELPALEVQYLPLTPDIGRQIQELRQAKFTWVVFLSANGVRALAALMKEGHVSPVIPEKVHIAAQGGKTALVCAQLFGRTPLLVPEEAVAENLAKNLLEQIERGGRVLLPISEDSRGVLPRALSEAGVAFSELVLYRTAKKLSSPESIPRLTRCKADELIFSFFSPSAVKSVWEGLGEKRDILRRSKIAVIGPVTAMAVRDLGLEVFLEARDHSDKGFVDALCSALGRAH